MTDLHKAAEMADQTVLVSLGDLWSGTCHCGARAGWGEATQNGPDGCKEAVQSGRVFCDAHIPANLLLPNMLHPAPKEAK